MTNFFGRRLSQIGWPRSFFPMKFLVGAYAVPCSCGSDEWTALGQIPGVESLPELLCAQCGTVQLEADLVLQAPTDAAGAAA